MTSKVQFEKIYRSWCFMVRNILTVIVVNSGHISPTLPIDFVCCMTVKQHVIVVTIQSLQQLGSF